MAREVGVTAAALDDRPVTAFVLACLPRRRCRVLEVGAGRGGLAAVMRRVGHTVTAIDPRTEPGAGVLPVALERHRTARRYDAAVAASVLHHLDDLGAALDHLAALLRPGGCVIVHEYGPDRLDRPTAFWLLDRWRRAGRDHEGEAPPPDVDTLIEEWRTGLAGIHDSASLLGALRRRFAELACTPAPYLAASHFDSGGDAETAAIRAGTIRALGYRWVGVRR